MNNSNSSTSKSSASGENVKQALLASKDKFAGEYGDGGVVISGVIAVGHDGRPLSTVALLPKVGDPVLPDAVYGDAVEEALARDLAPEDVAAYSGVRIERGWPRVIAWNPGRSIVWESRPQFEGEELIGWKDSKRKRLSPKPPTGSTNGLVEVPVEGAEGAVVLVVGQRIKAP
jgi:hypothetical protein